MGTNDNDGVSKYIARLVYDTTGIALYEGSSPLIRATVEHRLQELGLRTLDEYFATLSSREASAELNHLIELLPIGLTFFFRDKGQLQFLVEECVPRVLNGDTRLNVWCVPCSSGEEAYTLGILLSEHFSAASGRDWFIHATDISNSAIDKARSAVYPAERLKYVPVSWQEKYFDPFVTEGYYRVKPSMATRIRFERNNVFDDHAFDSPFHIIVCRNLLIYLDWYQQQKVVRHLTRYLAPNGFLMLGDLEGLRGLAISLQPVAPRVYQNTGNYNKLNISHETTFTREADHTQSYTRTDDNSYRILVVNEKPQLLEVISTFLASHGYHVDTASTDLEVQLIVRARTSTLIIIDLSFLEQYGMDLLSALCAESSTVPVLVLTSMGYDDQFLGHLLKNGVTMSLSKTLPIENLAYGVRRCLDRTEPDSIQPD